MAKPGAIPWSKGLTKATDPRLQRIAHAASNGNPVPADRQLLMRLLAEHGSTRAVAKAMGWAKSSVARTCRLVGIPVGYAPHARAKEAEAIVAAFLPGARWLAYSDRTAPIDMEWQGVRIDVKGARLLISANGSSAWAFSIRQRQVRKTDVFVLVALDVQPNRFWVIPASVMPLGRTTRLAVYPNGNCRWHRFEVAADGLRAAILAAKGDGCAQG